MRPLPHHIVGYLNYEKVSPEYKTFLLQIQDILIPKNRQEAMRSTPWKEAMDEEMRALMQNQTWEVVRNQLDVDGCIPFNVNQMEV